MIYKLLGLEKYSMVIDDEEVEEEQEEEQGHPTYKSPSLRISSSSALASYSCGMDRCATNPLAGMSIDEIDLYLAYPPPPPEGLLGALVKSFGAMGSSAENVKQYRRFLAMQPGPAFGELSKDYGAKFKEYGAKSKEYGLEAPSASDKKYGLSVKGIEDSLDK